ncbi:hypothetical protein [Dietzia cinnamea]|uniref:hypothetical protein n=1 Tax=Dietzia cinnamea TaxID=321318 RepID=UPI00223B1A60|nr:hypothetical protein [Dietzia cinnamea]MCT2061759.1 hypothetical protein [Dietzia cinnamea]MCT2235682.1 hypothetical protein [Dietzia cinnamea]MCT2300092.1 hypothetical protein [Dietzia cinnamea]
MRSIEDLTDAIRTHASRVQFREATRAYSAGAHRAATILLWTAVMQDLTDKLRVLAETGDSAASTAISTVDTARAARDVRKMQNFENGLLDRARDEFEFLTAREAEELRRLGDDRNLCAHPSFHSDSEEPFQIAAEQVRAYARLVVEAVLSQPPIVGKALVERFIADTKSDSWPDEALVDFLRSRYFDRARSGIMRNIISVAIKAAIRPPDGDNQIAGRCVAAIKESTEINEALVHDALADVLTKWRDHMSDTDLLRTVGAIGALSQTWDHVGNENLARIKTLLGSATADTLVDERVFASGPPAEPTLIATYASAIERLSPDHLDMMTRKPYPKNQWVPGVLRIVKAVKSWRGGERAIRLVIRVVDGMSLDDVEIVADEFLKNDQIHHASDVPQLLERLVDRTTQIAGARDVWRRTLDSYSAGRDPIPDGEDWYSYSEARAALER